MIKARWRFNQYCFDCSTKLTIINDSQMICRRCTDVYFQEGHEYSKYGITLSDAYPRKKSNIQYDPVKRNKKDK